MTPSLRTPTQRRPLSSSNNTLLLSLLPLPHLTRCNAHTRRDIEGRIPLKEITRSQQQRHRLGRHQREIFWGWKVRYAESVPENDVGVCD